MGNEESIRMLENQYMKLHDVYASQGNSFWTKFNIYLTIEALVLSSIGILLGLNLDNLKDVPENWLILIEIISFCLSAFGIIISGMWLVITMKGSHAQELVTSQLRFLEYRLFKMVQGNEETEEKSEEIEGKLEKTGENLDIKEIKFFPYFNFGENYIHNKKRSIRMTEISEIIPVVLWMLWIIMFSSLPYVFDISGCWKAFSYFILFLLIACSFKLFWLSKNDYSDFDTEVNKDFKDYVEKIKKKYKIKPDDAIQEDP